MTDQPYFCSRCMHALRDVDLPREEPVGCPYCLCGLLLVIDHAEWSRRQSALRSDWANAVSDGLIIPSGEEGENGEGGGG